jgi:hypothetical protein
MLKLAMLLIALVPNAAAAAQEGSKPMEVTRNGTQPSVKGPADWFTGDARIDSPFGRGRARNRRRSLPTRSYAT